MKPSDHLIVEFCKNELNKYKHWFKNSTDAWKSEFKPSTNKHVLLKGENVQESDLMDVDEIQMGESSAESKTPDVETVAQSYMKFMQSSFAKIKVPELIRQKVRR